MKYKLNQLTDYVSEGKIRQWHVKPGDTVKQGDVLCELECTKVNLEVTAPVGGVVGDVCAEQSVDSENHLISID